MPFAVIALTVTGLALTPPLDDKVVTARAPELASHGLCGAQFDPQFVRFVPPAPTASGHNPLFRLVSAPADDGAFSTLPRLQACKQMLTRFDGKR